MKSITKLQQPVARIDARNSSPAAKTHSSEDMSGLQPVIFLAIRVQK